VIKCLLENGRLDEYQIMALAASKSESNQVGLKSATVSFSQAFAKLAVDQLIAPAPIGIKEGTQNTLWLVNNNEINFLLCRNACAALVREKKQEGELDKESLSSPNETDIPQKGFNGISSGCIGSVNMLQRDHYDACKTLSCTNKYNKMFHDLKHFTMSLIRMKEIEAVVRERFGGPACRIFRLLLLKRNLEQKQIAEMAMIPVKDTRELLYKLLKAKYVQIQELARTMDHAPSRTFYLWRVDPICAAGQVGREIYKATFNLRARLMFEMTQEQETLRLLGKAQNTNDFPLTVTQRNSLMRIKTLAVRLEGSLLRLDELALFFNTHNNK